MSPDHPTVPDWRDHPRRVRGDGYAIRIGLEDHPDANKGVVLEHRLVMEELLGRRLRPGEVVYRKNSDRADNRPENLRVAPRGEHLADRRRSPVSSDELLSAVRRLAVSLGHTPTQAEISESEIVPMSGQGASRRFGGTRALHVAAGLIPNRQGELPRPLPENTSLQEEEKPMNTETTRDDLMEALREAGETLVREHHEQTGEVPTHLADEVTLQGDIDYLDDVARDHGLDDGMPDGYSRPLADEWRAVFEGTREALDALEDDG